MASIVSVYTERPHRLVNMSYIRWYRMAEALAKLGHRVDIAVGDSSMTGGWTRGPRFLAENLRKIRLGSVKWAQYDVVKVSYPEGWRTLKKYGGTGHRFIIARMGTVVGRRDMAGIVFTGRDRIQRYLAQREISRSARYVSVLNDAARRLWLEGCKPRGEILVVPGAADAHIPAPSHDPFPQDERKRCLFAGNLFSRRFADIANAGLSDKLNRLGAALNERGIRLYVLGGGDASRLDAACTYYLGAVECDEAWSYMQHSHVGIELVKSGRAMQNNESSKLYHYLHAGLPVVSETGLPNTRLLEETGHGFIVECDDLQTLTDRIEQSAASTWNKARVIEYMREHHTWDHRASIYHDILKDNQL